MNQVVVGIPMNQEKHKNKPQVFYNDKWVDKDTFRAFVYGEKGQKLAKSYKEYEDLLASGLWFDTAEKYFESSMKKPEAVKAEVLEMKKHKARKPKNGTDS